MTRAAIATLALIGVTSPAFAAGPPSYDIVKTCRIVAGESGNLAEMSYQGCMEAEHSSRADLTRRWSSISQAIRNDCLATEQALGGSGSYSGLKSCIDGEIMYAQWQKTHPNPITTARTERTEPPASPAPAVRGRRGGASGSPANQPNTPPTPDTGITPGTGLGIPGLGTPGTGVGGTGTFGTTGPGLGSTGIGTPGLGNTGVGTSGTAGTGLGTPGLGTGGGTGSSLGAGSTGGGAAGGAGASGGSGGGGGR